MKFVISFITATMCLLLCSSPLFAHHAAFYKAVFRAIEKGEVNNIKNLFDKPAWNGKEGAMSAAQLQERLKKGDLISPLGKVGGRLLEYASHDTSRSRCLVTFKLEYRDDKRRAEQMFLLAKRVGNDGNRNPKAWKIWRIVTDREQAECFLGRKF